MTTVDGLYAIGEANFSDHGANRLGASALMQGLADGYFVLPNTIGDYLAQAKLAKVGPEHAAFRQAQAEVAAQVRRLLDASGRKTVDAFHRELGRLMWDKCGMSRSGAGLTAAIERIGAQGEAKRDDARFAYVAAWEFTGVGKAPVLHTEPLAFETVHLSQRSYK